MQTFARDGGDPGDALGGERSVGGEGTGVVPGGFDQQPAGVLAAGLRDRSEPALVAG